jgi:hypothetical protein
VPAEVAANVVGIAAKDVGLAAIGARGAAAEVRPTRRSWNATSTVGEHRVGSSVAGEQQCADVVALLVEDVAPHG